MALKKSGKSAEVRLMLGLRIMLLFLDPGAQPSDSSESVGTVRILGNAPPQPRRAHARGAEKEFSRAYANVAACPPCVLCSGTNAHVAHLQALERTALARPRGEETQMSQMSVRRCL